MKNKTKLLLSCTIVVALIALVLVYIANDSGNEPSNQKTGSTINYDGPTTEEQAAGDTQKNLNEAEDQAIKDGSATTEANLVLSDASQYEDTVEVRASVTNMLEDGTCTAVFTKAGQRTVTTESSAFKDVSTTQCGANDTPVSKFDQKGDWLLTLSYLSASGKSASITRMVTIR